MTENSSKVTHLTYSLQEEGGQRIDNFLVKKLKGVPKSRIYKALRKGEIRVNGKRVKPETHLTPGDDVRIPPLRQAERAPSPIHYRQLDQLENSIIIEYNSLIIINKPTGIAVHGGSGLSFGVIEGMRQKYPQLSHLELAHRIDRDTSGCLLIAKKRSVLHQLHQQFKENLIGKSYLLLVHGVCNFQQITVDEPLMRYTVQSGERLVRTDQNGKASKTLFRVIRRGKNSTLLQAKPVTGRTHQIRVHATHLGHPIVGDQKYGRRELDQKLHPLASKRLYLHAASITFQLNNEPQGICACLDPLFSEICDKVLD